MIPCEFRIPIVSGQMRYLLMEYSDSCSSMSMERVRMRFWGISICSASGSGASIFSSAATTFSGFSSIFLLSSLSFFTSSFLVCSLLTSAIINHRTHDLLFSSFSSLCLLCDSFFFSLSLWPITVF